MKAIITVSSRGKCVLRLHAKAGEASLQPLRRGAMQQAASWALLEKLAHSDGQVCAATWHDYPIASALDAPESIEVILSDSHAPPTGIGEPGAVPVAAAIANAIYDASGIRLRELPLGHNGRA
jgi:CO/xanthine dehydrogenase Mo-binding subunit